MTAAERAQMPTVWPHLDARLASDLMLALQTFYAARTVHGTQEPLTRLMGLTTATVLRFSHEETVWACLALWAQQASSSGTPITAVEIGCFADTYHEQFAPQAGTAVLFIGEATAKEREVMRVCGFEAAEQVDPGTRLAASHFGTVRHAQEIWSTILGRPIEHHRPATVAATPSDNDFVDRTFAEAEAGDEGARLYIAAVSRSSAGDKPGALALLEEAGGMGHVGAMLAAAEVAEELGQRGAQLFWWEQAANAGAQAAQFNLGLALLEAGRLPEAQHWLEQAGSAGLPVAYAALIELADRLGDSVAQGRWAQAGARLEHPYCLEVHALNVIRGREEEPQVLREGIRLMEAAATQGHASAMDRAGSLHMINGNRVQARYWWEQAVAAGDPDAGARLVDHGLL